MSNDHVSFWRYDDGTYEAAADGSCIAINDGLIDSGICAPNAGELPAGTIRETFIELRLYYREHNGTLEVWDYGRKAWRRSMKFKNMLDLKRFSDGRFLNDDDGRRDMPVFLPKAMCESIGIKDRDKPVTVRKEQA